MRLTNTMREKFLDDVMNGIPFKNYFNIDDAKSEIIKEIESKLPQDLLLTVKNYPNLICRQKRIEFENFKYVRPNGWERILTVGVVDHENCVPIDINKWKEAYKLYVIEKDERDELSKRLCEIIWSCTTVAKLKLALPELESYMPKEPILNQVPIAAGSVITDLLQLGLKIPK